MYRCSLLYLLTYSSSSPMGHKASMSTLHCIRSLAACWASPHDRFICSSSCVTVLRQVVLGLPGFLLPGGVHLKAIFVMRSCSILNTCPSHLRRLCVISLMMLQLPVFLYSSLLEILLGQKIWHIRRRHPLWNTSILFMSVLTACQLSEPYSRTDFTLLLYRSIFVLRLYCFDLQIGQSWEKAPWAFPSLVLISLDAPLSLLIRLPR